MFALASAMEKKRSEDQQRLRELNERFLYEIENGKGWQEVKGILDDMKKIARRLDNIPGAVVSFDNYPQENNLGETVQQAGQ